MKPFSLFSLRPLASGFFLLASITLAHAQVAKNAVQENIGGIEVVTLKTGVKDVITLKGTLPAGDVRSPDSNPAIATLTGAMLDKGTTQHDKFAISQMLGDVGATISFSVGSSALNINAKCLREDLPLVLSLVSEQLRSPAFSAEEFEKLKKQLSGMVKRQLDDTDFRSGDAFSRAIYPLGHPNRSDTPSDILAGIGKATLADVKAFYAQYYGPASMKLVIVGDVDPTAAHAEISKVFAGWKGGVPADHPAKAGLVDAPREQSIYMPEKTNVSVTWGQATQMRYGDPDTIPLRLASSALGGGFAARLMGTVRDKEGLTYGISSYVAEDTFVDGDWRITANFAPENLEKGLASTKRELLAWYKDGVTDAELARVKGDYLGLYKIGLSTTDGLSSTILNTLNRDLPLSFIDDIGNKVNAVTASQVNAAIKKHLDPEKMVIIKAGTIPGAMPGK